MKRRTFVLAPAIVLLGSSSAFAQMSMPMASSAPHSGQPEASERPFLEAADRFVHAHYERTAEAKRAGFVEFTGEDSTGAISWANQRWMSTGADAPSQLWYDVNGRLIGADYSVLQNEYPQRPHLWGIDPQRWIKLGQHVHYGIKQPDGTLKYGGIGGKRFLEAGGGAISAPTKQNLVQMGLAKSTDDVAFIFMFPAIWDLQFWVIPNPDGAFAEKNPNVKPRNAQAHPM